MQRAVNLLKSVQRVISGRSGKPLLEVHVHISMNKENKNKEPSEMTRIKGLLLGVFL